MISGSSYYVTTLWDIVRYFYQWTWFHNEYCEIAPDVDSRITILYMLNVDQAFCESVYSQNIVEPVHEISNNVVCATSKASDQPAHTRSLVRAFASRLSILWLLSYWLNTIWSVKLTRGCRGSSESTLVKMSNCWKSHVTRVCTGNLFWNHKMTMSFSGKLVDCF